MSSDRYSTGQCSLTRAKSARPKLGKIIDRQECHTLLREARDSKIVYISGRAGQGKTTLALSWLKENHTKAVWLTLDEGDNLPIVFIYLIADAFAMAFPRTTFDLMPVPTSGPFDHSIFAKSYFRNLFAQVKGKYALVLDDFHSLAEKSPVYPLIEVLIEVLPPKVQLVFLSRGAPPSFLAKWIAGRQVFQLTGETLRFSVREIEILFEKVLGNPITRSEAETLFKMTEGWVTGLILLQERGEKSPEAMDPALSLPRQSDERVFDYLYQETYRGLDQSLQEIMLSTSFVESFAAEMARLLVPDANIASQIHFLINRHLLSEIPAGGTTRFRYHPLLRQFLQCRVRELPEDERHKLIQQVGAMQESQGQLIQATDLYLAYGYYDQAIRLIEQIGLMLLFEGKRMKLRQWIRSIPSTRIESHPWLSYFMGMTQAFADPKAAAQAYRLAQEGFEQTNNTEGQLWILASRMMLNFYAGEDFRPINTDARQGRKLLQHRGASCSSLVRVFFLVTEGFTTVFSAPHPQRSLQKILDAADLARQEGLIPLFVQATTYAGFTALWAGKLQLAIQLFTRIEKMVEWKKLDPVLWVKTLWYRGIVECFRGEHAKSLALLNKAKGLCQVYGLNAFLPNIELNLLLNRVIMGEAGEASVLLETIRQQTVQHGSRLNASFLSHCEAIYYLHTGAPLQALSHAEEAIRLIKAAHSPLIQYLPLCFLGVILREMGESKKAEKHLLEALAGFEKAQSHLFAFGALLHLAKLYLDRGDEKKARRQLSKALQMGKAESYVEGEGFTPQMMSVLLNRAYQWGLEPDYVQVLMKHWKVSPAVTLKIHTLGRFEVIVNGRMIPEEIWHGKKAKLFLIALLALGSKQVSKEAIIDLLWPEADGDRAVTSFHTTLHRLQTALRSQTDGETRLIELKDGFLSLNSSHCWCECLAFEDTVRQVKRAESAGQWNEARRRLQEAMSLYQGEFLPAFRREAWIESKRQALHEQFLWVKQRLSTLPS